MKAADILKEARLRSGLTQRELADRLGRPQPTVSRWESGAQEPGFAAVVDAVRRCGLELDVSVAAGDDSYLSLIHQQRHRSRTDRLAHASSRATRGALETLVRADVRFVLVGALAAAVHGSPVSAGGQLLIVPDNRPKNMERLRSALNAVAVAREPGRSEFWLDAVWRLPRSDVQVELMSDPPGTRGYADLAARAEAIRLDAEDEGVVVEVASLLDLLRIADASGAPELQAIRPAIQILLDPPPRRVASP